MTLPFVPEQSIGATDAGLVLVEFGDLQCPFCNHFAQHTLPQFTESYIATGKIRFFSVEFPLESHPQATRLSLASLCAGQQDHYWEMRDALITGTNGQPEEAISEAVIRLKLKATAFQDCMKSPIFDKQLAEHVAAARASGVYSTPTFLLGKVQAGEIRGVVLVGDMPPEQFNQQIEAGVKLLEGESNEQAKLVK